MVDPYILVLAGFGGVVLLTAWLPMVLKELPLSLPIICVALGALLFGMFNYGDPPAPQAHLALTERLTEFVVIVALMGAGLKLDRPLAWATAGLTWRLLGFAMPLTILAIALLAYGLLGTSLAAALLLGAALSPTDPVLASDVQVGPPGQGQEDEVRFTLTAEAGMNDGLAFPFVHLAILFAAVDATGNAGLLNWLTIDVGWRLAAGVAVGVAGYGFLAVFVAAVAFRATERRHRYHEKLHDFVEQIERLLMMILLVLFGGALAVGGLLRDLSWTLVAFATLTLLIVRPLAAWISLIGRKESASERAIIAFFGIRGIGSVCYLAYALGRTPMEDADLLWTAASLVILISIGLHGMTVTPVMHILDRRRGR